MDPVTLVSSAIALLSPYLAKGAEEFAKELGKEAAEKTKDLFGFLKKTFTHDSEESQVLSLFEKKPEKYQPMLSEVLEERAKTDKVFASELEKHVQSSGPYIKVLQKLKDSKDVVGAEVKKARTGKFDIQQEAERGERLVGFKGDEVG
jgi:hypothetical protein